MNQSISHLRTKPNICFFSDYRNDSFHSWLMDDWCELFASISYLTSPLYHLRYGTSLAPLNLAIKRDMRGTDIDADWFDSDLCIGYNSTFFCDLNVLNKVKKKKCKTALIINKFSISEKEKNAISSSLIDEVWILNYIYCKDIVDAVLSFNLMQKICIINDYYSIPSFTKPSKSKAIFLLRKNDTDYIKCKYFVESVSKNFVLDKWYFHEILKNKHTLFNEYDFIIFYASSDLSGEEFRILDFCSKNCFTVINNINDHFKNLYRTYSSLDEVLNMKKNYDKLEEKIDESSSISMKKAIIDIIQRR